MKIISPTDLLEVAERIADTLQAHLLKGETVTWLLSGGSALGLETAAARLLNERKAPMQTLRVSLVDERYGAVNHADENWSQLLHHGFTLPGATLYRVLQGTSPEETTQAFGRTIHQWLKTSDYSLAVLGIGADGHTAGIKAHSPAVTETDAACYYEWDDYRRITLTPSLLSGLDEAIIYAMGEEKKETLQALITIDMPPSKQPAQVLKRIKKSTLYTDTPLVGS